MEKLLGVPSEATISLLSLMINLAIGLAISLVTGFHYKKFASSLSNRVMFAKNFPFILLTTILIITIVKSSLALSLGLVGALSIVRFRTPIKEPEELCYLFICIAVGLGLGANQTLPTVAATAVILGAIAIVRWRSLKEESRNLFLSLNCSESDSQNNLPQRTNEIILKHARQSDLRRIDTKEKNWEAIFFIDLPSFESTHQLLSELKTEFPGISVTLIDQNQLPTV